MLAERMTNNILGDEDKIGTVFTVKEIADIQNIGVSRYINDGAESITNNLLLAFPRCFILIRVNGVDTQACRTTFSCKDVSCAILSETFVAAQPLFHLPITIEMRLWPLCVTCDNLYN